MVPVLVITAANQGEADIITAGGVLLLLYGGFVVWKGRNRHSEATAVAS